MRDVKGYLSKKQSEGGALSSEWASLEELYERRLWHQLTMKLMTFVKNDEFDKNGGLLEMYDSFISDFEHRINPLKSMEIMLYVIKEYEDPEKALEFLEKQREKVKSELEAEILCLTAIGNKRLKQNNMEETKDVISQTRGLLDTIDGVTTVHSRFYKLCSNFHQITGSYNDYYRDALRYLGCVELKDLAAEEKTERALHLSLAALLGSEVYNFGELLAHEVLKSLHGTPHGWLVELLFAFNSGDIEKFERLRTHWQKQPDLNKNYQNLRQKITLLCLMELTFKRPSHDRNLKFDTIAKEAKIPENEVELLVMKALSVGLVKGSIDEVEKTVHVTWVQPRVLDVNQIANMKERLTAWCDKVKTQVYSVEDQVPELIV